MSSKYSISCSSMNEHDVALIKSLLAIVGKNPGAEWVYSESPSAADVVIMDTDSQKPAGLTVKPRAIVAYATADQTLIPNTYALQKPARARSHGRVVLGAGRPGRSPGLSGSDQRHFFVTAGRICPPTLSQNAKN